MKWLNACVVLFAISVFGLKAGASADALSIAGDISHNVKSERYQAISELGKRKDAEAEAALISILTNKSDAMGFRNSAAVALGEMNSEKALEPMLTILKDTGEVGNVRAGCAYAAARVAPMTTMPVLVALLGDSSAEVRAATVYALGKIAETARNSGDNVVLSKVENSAKSRIIIMLGSDADYQVRRNAAQALGNIGNTEDEVVSALSGALRDKEPFVKQWAILALGNLKVSSPQAVKGLAEIVAMDDDASDDAAESLGNMGNAASDAAGQLKAALKSKKPEVRSSSARALGKIGGKAAVMDVAKLLKDNNEQVRVSAAMALANLKSPESVDELVKSLSDESHTVQAAAGAALMSIGTPEAKKAAEDFFRSEKYQKRSENKN